MHYKRQTVLRLLPSGRYSTESVGVARSFRPFRRKVFCNIQVFRSEGVRDVNSLGDELFIVRHCLPTRGFDLYAQLLVIYANHLNARKLKLQSRG